MSNIDVVLCNQGAAVAKVNAEPDMLLQDLYEKALNGEYVTAPGSGEEVVVSNLTRDRILRLDKTLEENGIVDGDRINVSNEGSAG